MLDPQASRFWQSALLSGLMDAKGLAACWDAIPPAKRAQREHIDRRLARQAVHLKELTLWQAQQLLAGRAAGYKVDRYVLLDLIGQGGMGRVYLAQDTRLDRRVALKILSPERINNPRAIARFQREARVGAQLQHENLVRIYDFGESKGRFYLVMEYIEGKTIGTLISEHRSMPPCTAVRLARQVALGLEHAHRKGLIHRDVNPYNILVTRDGTAKLADMGLAIDLADEERVTREGATVGTFDYVAPEQARHSHSADIRSDIYSLGCTLYHMLAGQVPFPSPSLPEKLFGHQALEPAPLAQLAPGLHEGLIEVVQRMMRKSPDERYATPLIVAQALEPYEEDNAGANDTENAPQHLAKPPGAPSPTSPPPDRVKVVVSGQRRTESFAAVEKTAAGALDAKVSPGAAPEVGPLPSTVGSTIPVFSPVNDGSVSDEDFPIGLDLGPEPTLSAGLSRPRSRTVTSATLLAAHGAASSGLLPRGWRWGLLALTSTVVAAAVYAALGNPLRDRLAALLPQLGSSPAVQADAGTRPPRAPHAISDGPKANPEDEPAIAVVAEGEKAIPANSLSEAIQTAMRNGSAVELRNHEPLRLTSDQALDFKSGQGLLSLRGAPGTNPVIEIELKDTRPFLSSGSGVSVKLSGLTIVVHYEKGNTSPASLPPVTMAAGKIKLDRCAFKVAAGSWVNCSRALVSLGGAVEVDRCWFQGFDKAIELSASGRTASIRQTMFVPGPGLAQGQPPELHGWMIRLSSVWAKNPKHHLILDHCTVEGAGVFDLTGTGQGAPLQVNVTNCVVRADALLACKPNPLPAAQILWEGKNNQYEILGRSWIVLSSTQGTPALLVAATDMDSWLAFASKDTSPVRTKLKYQIDPAARSESLQPSDFTVEAVGPPDNQPGANPALVGPWSNP
jgi:serine/threonine-protein kinase